MITKKTLDKYRKINEETRKKADSWRDPVLSAISTSIDNLLNQLEKELN